LEEFLVRRRAADPVRFPDLSLTIVKLMGAGEYVIDKPGSAGVGHFGLAVRDYAHSTAPNRRFPDLVTLRLVKAALLGAPSPYTDAELLALAKHCSEQEDDTNRVERQVRKSAAAMLLASHVGELFDAIVTGASAKGTYVRVFAPPVEGRFGARFGGLQSRTQGARGAAGRECEARFHRFRAAGLTQCCSFKRFVNADSAAAPR